MKYFVVVIILLYCFLQDSFCDSILSKAIGQAYKFMSNEYRHFPARARLNVCKILKANVVGVLDAISKCGNTTSCFYTKETTYHMCNFVMDPTHLPPLIPDGEYKLEVELFYLENSIAIANIYGEVYRPIYPK